MAKYGKLNIKDLQQYAAELKKVQDTDAFLEGCAKELAARLLAKVIKRTPVGQYPKSSGKMGGTLRRGWTGGVEGDGASYAQSLAVEHTGNTYRITITNPVEYAPYVEFGHRTANYKGWVEGQFFMTISEKELQEIAPKVLEARLLKYLKGLTQ